MCDMEDTHLILSEANAQLNGIRNLTVEAGDGGLYWLKAFELDMLLKPVTERLERAMQLLETE